MPDPYHKRKNTRIAVDVSYKGIDDPVRVYLNTDKEKFDELGKGIFEEIISSEMLEVAPRPVNGVLSTYVDFQYADDDALADFDYANTLVEVNLPYCLHLPNEHEIEVDIPEEGIKAFVIFKKFWTEKATENSVGSSEIDFYAKDRVLYFQKSTILTPKLPLRPREGWEQHFTGKNIENIKEQNGVFRYSKLYIQFDFDIPVEKLSPRDGNEYFNDVKNKALVVVNRIIDCYRVTTEQDHVQRLGNLGVNMIYFRNHRTGFYVLSPGFGIMSAIINRSSEEIESIGKMLEDGRKPDLYSLLLLDASCSFDHKNYALAVVQSFQALDIFLEAFLLEDLQKKGYTEDDATKYLEKYLTKERLKICLKELRNASLAEANKIFWDEWLSLYKETRNKIIHKGKEPRSEEVANVLAANIKVIEWLKSL